MEATLSDSAFPLARGEGAREHEVMVRRASRSFTIRDAKVIDSETGKANRIFLFAANLRKEQSLGRSQGCGSPVIKVSDHDRHAMSLIPVPLKTRRVEQRCMLNLSRAETSSRWCGVVVRRGGASSGVVHVT
ncbi:uncharacterized protein TNCV_362461 [Trichonephila clavipes]|nr:uncharacterized protein TNCV_362461 [Trichonephila clavipes]